VCLRERERERENLIWMLSGKGNFEARKAQVQTTIYFQTYSYVLFNDAPWCRLYNIGVRWNRGMKNWQNNPKEKMKILKEKPVCHFSHHKSHMHWPQFKPSPP
jgi:hypothetical protein